MCIRDRINAIEKIEKNEANFVEQNHDEATYAKKITKKEAELKSELRTDEFSRVSELKKLYNAQMINLIGDQIVPYRSKKYSDNEFFFDYLKKKIKDKRKMGHLTKIL